MEKTEIKSDDNDCDIVTETTIVGVTESGVIRKRSVKRRISKEDSSHAAKAAAAAVAAERKYGHDTKEYRKLTERVLGERATTSALELLQERCRMLTFMHEDCLELVKQWDDRQLIKQHKRRKRRLLFLALLSLPVGFVLVTWFLTSLCL